MTRELSKVGILRGALALIVTPERWTQGAGARNKYGGVVAIDDVHATCFCPVAAIHRAAGNQSMPNGTWRHDIPEIVEAVHAVGLELARPDLRLDYPDSEIDEMEFGVVELINMNDLDDVRHEQVVAAFCTAIIRA